MLLLHNGYLVIRVSRQYPRQSGDENLSAQRLVLSVDVLHDRCDSVVGIYWFGAVLTELVQLWVAFICTRVMSKPISPVLGRLSLVFHS